MLQFTIREAILMTTIVAVLLMWWMERSQNAKYDSRLTAIETKLQSVATVPSALPVRVLTNVATIPNGASVPLVPPPLSMPTTSSTITTIPPPVSR
jgi:hypothetical protein